MGRAAKLKKMRRRAENATMGNPYEYTFSDGKSDRLGQCTKGAYRALKRGKFTHRVIDG